MRRIRGDSICGSHDNCQGMIIFTLFFNSITVRSLINRHITDLEKTGLVYLILVQKNEEI